MIILVALCLQADILNSINTRNINKTSEVVLDQTIGIIEKNQKDEQDMIQSLKEDYIVRAKGVAYILDAKPEAERATEELQKIAELMSIDEIHLFHTSGTIYSGTVPLYYGYNFGSGEQIAYFKPMLKDKSLTMCQDVTPNTSEGKQMMYAMTWNEAGTYMVQVGIEPVRLLEEVKKNEVDSVVSNMPMYEGMKLYVADPESGKIYGATDEEDVGKTLDDIGIPENKIVQDEIVTTSLNIQGARHQCVFEKSGDYVVGVTFAIAADNESNLVAILLVAVYLLGAAAGILTLVNRVLKANREKKEQFAVLASMPEIYHSMHLIRLDENSVMEYSGTKEECKLYSKILRINLTEDSYRVLNWEENEESTGKKKIPGSTEKLSELLKVLENPENIHPDDLEKYQKQTAFDYLRNHLDEDHKRISVTYRRKENEKYKVVTMEVIPADDYTTKNRAGFLYVKG